MIECPLVLLGIECSKSRQVDTSRVRGEWWTYSRKSGSFLCGFQKKIAKILTGGSQLAVSYVSSNDDDDDDATAQRQGVSENS